MGFNLEDYTTVAERIKIFRQMYPMGRILTDCVVETDAKIVFKAELYRDDEDTRPFSTGWAKEVISDRGVNRDFALENCETSSIGIACKNADIGTEKHSISREEAAKVNRVSGNKFEQRIAEKIQVEKPTDPWTIETKEMPLPVSEAVTALNEGIVPEEIPTCPKHKKPMQPKVGNKNGRDWKHYKCIGEWPDTCDQIIWMEIDKSGRWVPQRPRPTQGAMS